MNLIDTTFQELRAARRCAFAPFLTAGDPDLETTGRLVRALAERGADVIELGIPYSDPIADGPVIQASYTRVLERGLHLAEIFAAVRGWSHGEGAAGPLPPLVSMVSYSIVYRHGPEQYVRDAVEAGFAGAIVPDLPAEEADGLTAVAAEHEFSLIQLITPTTPPERAARIAATSTGFIYYVSVAGITGERDRLPEGLVEQIGALRKITDLPLCVGFGISRPEQVRHLRDVADGVIVGSAIVRRIEQAAGAAPEQLVAQVGRFAAELIDALERR